MTRDPKCAATEGTGLTAMTNLPPSLLCKRTGLAAGLDETCPCDACFWVRVYEDYFREVEREEAEPDDAP